MWVIFRAQTMFRSTPLREGRLCSRELQARPPRFRSTPLREGRHCILLNTTLCSLFRSTPLREGRLQQTPGKNARKNVSIHAPARGATLIPEDVVPPSCVSIHAPARGATMAVSHSGADKWFRSTPLREGRPARGQGSRPLCEVSIHAPARGATPGAG